MLANNYFSLRKLKDDVFRENHVYLTTFSAFSTIGSADAHFLRADSEISCIFTSDNVSLNKFDEVFFRQFSSESTTSSCKSNILISDTNEGLYWLKHVF